MENEKDLTTEVKTTAVGAAKQPVYGFEETKSTDILIPRIKVINALSPERVDGIAAEGDILNSLTGENMAGRLFVPIKQYYSNICWNPDRNSEQRIFCRSMDGHIGEGDDGVLACETCKKNQFDNTKTGKASQPTCTAYLNFLGFFRDDPMPVVLSFARTNYNDGKKLLSIAKSMRCSIWNYAYKIFSKKVTKDRNTWYIMVPSMSGQTTEDERMLALEVYNVYKTALDIKADYEDTTYTDTDDANFDAQTAAEV